MTSIIWYKRRKTFLLQSLIRTVDVTQKWGKLIKHWSCDEDIAIMIQRSNSYILLSITSDVPT